MKWKKPPPILRKRALDILILSPLFSYCRLCITVKCYHMIANPWVHKQSSLSKVIVHYDSCAFLCLGGGLWCSVSIMTNVQSMEFDSKYLPAACISFLFFLFLFKFVNPNLSKKIFTKYNSLPAANKIDWDTRYEYDLYWCAMIHYLYCIKGE